MGPFKKTARTLFQPSLFRMKKFQTMWDDNSEHPPYHDVSKIPTRRPPTSKVFKVATKNVREQQGDDCSQEFAQLMKCVNASAGTTGQCDDLYEALKACQKGLDAGSSKNKKGLNSKKYHVERVYNQFGEQTRQRKGKGQKWWERERERESERECQLNVEIETET